MNDNANSNAYGVAVHPMPEGFDPKSRTTMLGGMFGDGTCVNLWDGTYADFTGVSDGDRRAWMAKRAQDAVAAEDDYTDSLVTVVNSGICELCNSEPQTKRTLCNSCYNQAMRDGELSQYPTKDFLNDPSAAIGWAFQYRPDLIPEIAATYGYTVTIDMSWSLKRPVTLRDDHVPVRNTANKLM